MREVSRYKTVTTTSMERERRGRLVSMLYAGEPSRLSRYKLYKTIPTDGGGGGGGGGGTAPNVNGAPLCANPRSRALQS